MKEKEILLGIKVGMTQVYDDSGRLVPVTVVQAGPCPVVQIKNTDTDGYNAVQIGFRAQKESRLSNTFLGHLKKSGVSPVAELAEFRTANPSQYKPGTDLTVAIFAKGEKVDVIGTTKGRGFQGVMKRWNFAGGPASHGSMFHRRGGSYGQRTLPGEIWKGKKMPGHMGVDRRTVQNLEVIDVIPEKNVLLIKGSFAGANGGMIVVRKAVKAKQTANKK
jgi:large subunit ribosomal protein L3